MAKNEFFGQLDLEFIILVVGLIGPQLHHAYNLIDGQQSAVEITELHKRFVFQKVVAYIDRIEGDRFVERLYGSAVVFLFELFQTHLIERVGSFVQFLFYPFRIVGQVVGEIVVRSG